MHFGGRRDHEIYAALGTPNDAIRILSFTSLRKEKKKKHLTVFISVIPLQNLQNKSPLHKIVSQKIITFICYNN